MPHTPLKDRSYCTTGEMAKALGCAQFTVIRRIDAGKLPAYRLPGGPSHRRCSKRAFDRHLRRQREQASKASELEAHRG